MKCGWCHKDYSGIGWHDCPQAKAGRQKLEAVLNQIHYKIANPPEKIV